MYFNAIRENKIIANISGFKVNAESAGQELVNYFFLIDSYHFGLNTAFCPPSSTMAILSCVPLYPTSAEIIFLLAIDLNTAPESKIQPYHEIRAL